LYFDSTEDAVRIPHVIKAADHIAFKYSNKALKKCVENSGLNKFGICDVNHFKMDIDPFEEEESEDYEE